MFIKEKEINLRGCNLCSHSGWVVPPPSSDHTCAAIAMPCECRGGVTALVGHFRGTGNWDDSVLAKKIEQTWYGITAFEYSRGAKRPKCKCMPEQINHNPLPAAQNQPHVNFRADIDG